MKFHKNIFRFLFSCIPVRNATIYRVCERYVDRFNGDNNSDPEINGENRLIREVLSSAKGEVVFDVGANVGNWSRNSLEVEELIHLHCFEPSCGAFKKPRSK